MQQLNALTASRRIANRYSDYLKATFSPQRAEWRREFESALDGFELSNGPLLQASPPFEHGASIANLVDEGVLSPSFTRIDQAALPIDRPLYLHQEQAIRRAVTGGRNLIVTTGTGSGKTECFLIPIIDGLLKEIDSGTIATPGVRALLLYPMNALANDQVKRLRQLLATVPEITFGRYVGETKHSLSQAEDDMRARYPDEPRHPNELISREQMQERPPHILLTNYAMLEYLLLRPTDAPLFDGDTAASWRHVVLDEAHVYGGAQGAEVAMLMRRVRERVLESERGRLQCFATSATLGRGEEDYPGLVSFAESLFDECFEWITDEPTRHDVVAAIRRPLVRGEAAYELPESAYGELLSIRERDGKVGEMADFVASLDAAIPVPVTDTVPAFLSELLRHDRRTIRLQHRVGERSAGVVELTRDLFSAGGADDLVALVNLAVSAREHLDDAPLLPGRYHFMLRSLEGAFACLHPDHPAGAPRLLLRRNKTCPTCTSQGTQSHMVELGTCRRCGAEYVVGRLEERTGFEQLVQPQLFDSSMRYYLLGDALDADDEDQVDAAIDDDVAPHERWLCPGCGAISESAGGPCGCEGGQPPRRQVTAAVLKPGSSTLHRCLACASRTTPEIVFRFLTGTDAPVAVIATELYQAIPPSSAPRSAHLPGQGRKLLTFSDSRQDAAFFAPYLERTYLRSVQRRMIADAVIAGRGEYRTDDLVIPIRETALDALVLDPDDSPAKLRTEIGTWLMLEALGFDRRNNLEGTGIAEVCVATPRRYEPPRALVKLGLSEDEAVDVIRMLLSTLRDSGAVTVPAGVDIRDEVFAPRNREVSVRGAGSENGMIAWNPASSASNRRIDLLTKVFQRREIEQSPREVLERLWEHLTTDPAWSKILQNQNTKQGVSWRLSHEYLQFVPATEDHRPYRCARCRKISWRNVADVCPTFRCDGSLEAIDDLDELWNQHYARLYRTIEPIGMAVQEHTAHWTSSRAAELQSQFTNGSLNVLSCSTTFELGVDVGDVQTVLLRNMPPSPANYVQRAGRAGRRSDSAALVVTFAQRRSHDLTFFDAPGRMIDGRIDPPVIMLENATIARRHAHSVAFADFERLTAEHRNVSSFFVDDTTTGTGRSACSDFVAWLQSEPAELRSKLRRVMPPGVADRIGIDDWAWVRALAESTEDEPTFGWLERADAEVLDDVATISSLEAEASAAGKHSLAGYYQRVGKTIRGRNLLGFLASRNVLPKYGFPVDVVELNLARSGDGDAPNLELTRDLRIAISEYAPGSNVVAGKQLWVSHGLAVRSDRALPRYRWTECGGCKRFRYQLGEAESGCPSCGDTASARGGTFITPIFGFAGGKADGKPGESRPPRSGTVDTFFGSYKDTVPKFVVAAELSGVRYRTSRAGRVSVINRGPAGRGFRICEWCGHGMPAPSDTRQDRGRTKTTTHRDARRPDRQCAGTLHHRHLGHEYLTDTIEIDVSTPMDADEALSTLHALLQGANALNIQRADIDGALSWGNENHQPSIVLLDAVPGGAGHALRIGERLDELMAAALSRVQACECAPDTSCYSCLRDYSNQHHHDRLQRDHAIRVLGALLSERPASSDLFDEETVSDMELLHPDARSLVRAIIELGGPTPIVGWELEGSHGDLPWIIEAAWPESKVALLIDQDHERDQILDVRQWDRVGVDADAATVHALVTRSGAAS